MNCIEGARVTRRALAGVSLGSARGFAGAVAMSAVDELTLAGDSPRRPMAAALQAMYPGRLRALGATASLPAGGAGCPATDLGGLKGVTVLTVSEFGRRVRENASHGADHGHGNAMLLLGDGIRGGKVYAKWPGLDPGALLDGDLAATTDHRAVIGEILRKRCGFGSLSGVFPGIAPSAFGLCSG